MSWLVRLYPRSWRKRYGEEMEDLVQKMPGRLSVALDLLIGAAIAYRDVIRRERVLSAAGAFLHGVCVAVLLQAIAFVTLILAGQGSSDPTDVRLGPLVFATMVGLPQVIYAQLGESLQAQASILALSRAWWPEAVLLTLLVFALAIVLATPRLLRRLR